MLREDIKLGSEVSFVRARKTRAGAVMLRAMRGTVMEAYRAADRVCVHVDHPKKSGHLEYWLMPDEVQPAEAERGLRQFITDALPYARRLLAPQIAEMLADLLAALKPEAKLPERVISLRIKADGL